VKYGSGTADHGEGEGVFRFPVRRRGQKTGTASYDFPRVGRRGPLKRRNEMARYSNALQQEAREWHYQITGERGALKENIRGERMHLIKGAYSRHGRKRASCRRVLRSSHRQKRRGRERGRGVENTWGRGEGQSLHGHNIAFNG